MSLIFRQAAVESFEVFARLMASVGLGPVPPPLHRTPHNRHHPHRPAPHHGPPPPRGPQTQCHAQPHGPEQHHNHRHGSHHHHHDSPRGPHHHHHHHHHDIGAMLQAVGRTVPAYLLAPHEFGHVPPHEALAQLAATLRAAESESPLLQRVTIDAWTGHAHPTFPPHDPRHAPPHVLAFEIDEELERLRVQQQQHVESAPPSG